MEVGLDSTNTFQVVCLLNVHIFAIDGCNGQSCLNSFEMLAREWAFDSDDRILETMRKDVVFVAGGCSAKVELIGPANRRRSTCPWQWTSLRSMKLTRHETWLLHCYWAQPTYDCILSILLSSQRQRHNLLIHSHHRWWKCARLAIRRLENCASPSPVRLSKWISTNWEQKWLMFYQFYLLATLS